MSIDPRDRSAPIVVTERRAILEFEPITVVVRQPANHPEVRVIVEEGIDG